MDLKRLVLCAMILKLWSSPAMAACDREEEDKDNKQFGDLTHQAAYSPESSSQIKVDDIQYAKEFISFVNARTGRHIEVTTHEETKSVDLKCFDCTVDELNSLRTQLASINNRCHH